MGDFSPAHAENKRRRASEMGLIVLPTHAVEKIDDKVREFRAAFPDASDDDAAEVRQQFVNIVAEYGHIPDFEIVKNPSAPATEKQTP